MHAGPGRFTLVMVLPPHEDAAPVGQVVRHDRQPVPPGLHHRLHVMEAVVPAQVGGLQARIYLCSFLKLDDLLGSLRGAWRNHSWGWGGSSAVRVLVAKPDHLGQLQSDGVWSPEPM